MDKGRDVLKAAIGNGVPLWRSAVGSDEGMVCLRRFIARLQRMPGSMKWVLPKAMGLGSHGAGKAMTIKAYRPAEYWWGVAAEIARRTEHTEIAGDNAPFQRYMRATFLTEFLDQLPVRGQRVLQIGCGPGGNLRRIAQAKPRLLLGVTLAGDGRARAEPGAKRSRNCPGLPAEHAIRIARHSS